MSVEGKSHWCEVGKHASIDTASYNGISFNDNVLRGPDVNNLLLGVLLRFRLFRVAFSGDVQCMYHCFYVAPEHRDLLRFFW